MIIEIRDTQGGVHDWSLRNGAIENEGEGTVTVFDPHGVYTVSIEAAGEALAKEPEPEPERIKGSIRHRLREWHNAEVRAENARGYDPWNPTKGQLLAPWEIEEF